MPLNLVNAAVAATLLCALPVRANDAVEQVLEATFRVVERNASATCFLLETGEEAGPASIVLVTAAHFFEGTVEPECRLMFRTRNGEGRFSRLELPLPIRENGRPLWTRHKELDVTLLPVRFPDGTDVRPLPFRLLSEERHLAGRDVRVGSEVFIPCYPAKLESNGTGWPVLRKGMIASHPLLPLAEARTILVDAKTFGGDSGAPVFLVHHGEPLIVGLVQGMHRQTDKATLPFEERTMHTPLGLAIVVQAPFIRETLAPRGE